MVSLLYGLPQWKIYQQIQSPFLFLNWLCLHKLGHVLLYQGVRVAMYFFRTNAWAIISCLIGSIKVFLQSSVCLIFLRRDLLTLYSIFPPPLHTCTVQHLNLARLWPRTGAEGAVAVEPPSARPWQDASEGTGWGETPGSSQVGMATGLPPGSIWLVHQPARLTQLIPLAVRASCQTVPSFWSLSAQARFKLASCGWRWISSLLPRVTSPLFFKWEFILLGRCW